MKLRQKILLLSVLPVILLGTFLYLFASFKIKEGIYQEAYTGMHATTLAVRSIFETGNSGEYQLDENGELWKGPLNISQSIDIVDQIKDNTNMEVSVFYNDTRYLTTIVNEDGERQIHTQASDTVVQTVLQNGQDYSADNVDILGTKYIVFYIPIYQENTQTPIGMVFLGTRQSKVNQNINSMQRELFLIVLGITLIVAAATSFVVQKIMKALSISVDTVNEIADGNLNIAVDKKYLVRKDEIGDMCRSIEKLDKKLVGIIGEIKNNSNYLTNASNKLDDAAKEAANSINQVDYVIQEIATSANQQTLSTESAAEEVAVMGGMVDETTNVITKLNNTTDRMKNAAAESKDTLVELNQSMYSVMDAIDSINTQTNKTNESVIRIGEAAKLITGLAHRTNLLALNASIEAARAGEQGKGFAVVASEIKQLSTQSTQSASEIQTMLEQLTDNSNQAVTMMQEAKGTIVTQKANLTKTFDVFQMVQEGIEQSVDGILAISNKTDILNSARNKTISVVENLTAIAEENAAGTQEAAASVEEVSHLVQDVADHADDLNEIAEGLKNSINVFRL